MRPRERRPLGSGGCQKCGDKILRELGEERGELLARDGRRSKAGRRCSSCLCRSLRNHLELNDGRLLVGGNDIEDYLLVRAYVATTSPRVRRVAAHVQVYLYHALSVEN